MSPRLSEWEVVPFLPGRFFSADWIDRPWRKASRLFADLKCRAVSLDYGKLGRAGDVILSDPKSCRRLIFDSHLIPWAWKKLPSTRRCPIFPQCESYFLFFLPFSLSLSLSLSPIKLSPWCNTSSKRFIWNEDHARSDRCRLKWYDLICTSIIPASFDRKETRNSHSASLHSYVILLPRFY